MEILMDLRDILIRATYSRFQITTSIKEISLGKAVAQLRTGIRASLVEHCDCPRAYTG